MIYSTDDLLIGRQLCSSWSVLAYVPFTVSRRSAQPPRLARHAVLVHAVLPGTTIRWSILAESSRTWQPHSTCLRRWEATSRNAPPLKTTNSEETRDNFNGDPRGLDLFKTCFWTASTIMFLECRESMSFGKQQGRRARLRITRSEQRPARTSRSLHTDSQVALTK
jgi:hypothetical protein